MKKSGVKPDLKFLILGGLFSAYAESLERHIPDLVLVVDNHGNAGEEVGPVPRGRVMESEIDGSVRCKNGEREDEVVVRANDAELVH